MWEETVRKYSNYIYKTAQEKFDVVTPWKLSIVFLLDQRIANLVWSIHTGKKHCYQLGLDEKYGLSKELMYV